jgi:YidC/Oxa1 family membrane protein insertase
MFNTLLVHPLFNLLALIYALIPGHDFGVAVIILTLLVRVALWPVITKQLHSQRTMQALAPEVAKVKARAKGDKQRESQLLMELYKEKGVSPFSSLLPILVQLPLFIALFVVLRDIIKPGEIASLSYGFVKHLGPIRDIIAGGGAFHPRLLGLVDLAATHNIVLAATAGLSQYLQTKQLAPQHPDQQSQSMFKATGVIFPALTLAIAYSLPAALALYWTVTSAAAIFQQRLILQRDVEELEAKKT